MPQLPVAQSKSPTRDEFTKYRGHLLRVALLNLGFGVGFYTVFVFAVSLFGASQQSVWKTRIVE